MTHIGEEVVVRREQHDKTDGEKYAIARMDRS
jgi:hypothetical protein